MSIITKISQQRRQNRCNIFLDNEFVCGLEIETIVKNGIKVGQELTEEKLARIQIESEERVAFDSAMNKVARKLCTTKEIFDYLSKKGFLPQTIQKVIQKLKEYGYVSDIVYAQAFLKTKNAYGKRVVQQKMFQKGISKEIVNNIEFDEAYEQLKCNKLAEKYVKLKEKTPENKQKTFRFLMSHGFEFEVAKKSIEIYFGGKNDENWD